MNTDPIHGKICYALVGISVYSCRFAHPDDSHIRTNHIVASVFGYARFDCMSYLRQVCAKRPATQTIVAADSFSVIGFIFIWTFRFIVSWPRVCFFQKICQLNGGCRLLPYWFMDDAKPNQKCVNQSINQVINQQSILNDRYPFTVIRSKSYFLWYLGPIWIQKPLPGYNNPHYKDTIIVRPSHILLL